MELLFELFLFANRSLSPPPSGSVSIVLIYQIPTPLTLTQGYTFSGGNKIFKILGKKYDEREKRKKAEERGKKGRKKSIP